MGVERRTRGKKQRSVGLAGLVGPALAGMLLMTGCRIDSHKDGKNDNVKIATPFGALQVKTNDSVVAGAQGLPEYPGATVVKKDKDTGAADVNLSFGNFQFRVKAVSYESVDSAEKVEAFYRKALTRYGTVIQCANDRPVGTPVQTAEGLTCENEKQVHVTTDEKMSRNRELKAGSKQHQHIVAIESQGSGTKFGVVVLDLPGHMTWDSDTEAQ